MNGKKLLSLFLIFLIMAPPTQGWSIDPTSRLEDQARFHLQKIGPELPPPPGQLQRMPVSPPPEAKILTTAPRQPEEVSAAEKRAAEYGISIKQFGYSFFYKPPPSAGQRVWRR